MNDNIEQQVKQIAADVFGLRIDRVSMETSTANVENWDSVQHLSFVLALEHAFEFELEPEEIEQMRTIRAAVEAVRGKIAKRRA